MPRKLIEFYTDLDVAKSRIKRPSKVVFFCGGSMPADNDRSLSVSLRDHLLRRRKISGKLTGQVLLAEKAQKIYRDSQYSDLISFEEDIARLSAIVLVIVESPGSFAELGAFATNSVIVSSLRVLIQEQYEPAESFIRYGPVEKLIKERTGSVGFFPWRIRSSGKIVAKSIDRHVNQIIRFINVHLNKIPKSTRYPECEHQSLLFSLYWTIYVANAITYTNILVVIKEIMPNVVEKDLKNKLYCLSLVGWISKISYSGEYYYYVTFDEDPFEYTFKTTVRDKDSTRRKVLASLEIKTAQNTPRHVLTHASLERRRPA